MASSPRTRTHVYPASCEPCRRRKCRCNRVKPCANCELRGLSDQCYDRPPRIEGRRVSHGAVASQDTPMTTMSRERSASPPVRKSTSVSNPQARPISIDAASTPSTQRRTTNWTDSIVNSSRSSPYLPSRSPSSLTAKAPENTNKVVHYDEVSHHLPSATLSLQFLYFFFDELVEGVSFVCRDDFLDRINSLLNRQGSLSRQEASLLFWILSYSSLIAPPRHALRSTFIDLEKSASRWKEVAQSFQTPHQSSLCTRSDALLGVALCVMEGMWHTYQSDFESSWEATGAGIRKAAALHLFTYQRQHSRHGSTSDGLIVTHHLVQKLLVMDRWIAFADLRALGIHPSDVCLPPTGTEKNLRAEAEHVQIQLLESARDLMLQFEGGSQPRETLYSHLRALLQTIDDECSRIISRYTAETPVKLDPSHCAQRDSAPHASILLSWLASCAFIGCSTSTRFSSDPDAPADIRSASLHWANKLMVLAPSLNAVHLEGKQALRLSRIAKHFFYALRAVFLALAGQEIQQTSENRTFNDALILGSSSWAHTFGNATADAVSGQAAAHSLASPNAVVFDYSLLHERFQSSMLLLRHFSDVKCRAATLALTLVENVLSVNSVLSSKLGVKTGEERVQGVNENNIGGGAIIGQDSDTPAGHTTGLLTSPNDNRNPYDPLSLPLADNAMNSMHWSTSELDFLTPHDIDAFLASFVVNP